MGIAVVVVGAPGAAVSGSAVSVVPPEQAETNMLRTRNPATPRFMPGVFHESRSATQRESSVERPCASEILENYGRPTVTICVIRRRSPNLDRKTGLRFQACRRGSVGGAGGNRLTEICPRRPPRPLSPVESGLCACRVSLCPSGGVHSVTRVVTYVEPTRSDGGLVLGGHYGGFRIERKADG